MEVSQTNRLASPPPVPAAQAADAKGEISSDFETFLRMLTVQMQNQDPLNPVESSDFAVQLATFSGVEQAVLTNDLLKQMTAQVNGSSLADMANWVGKEARAPAAANFIGDPITITPNPQSNADRAEIIVRNASGVEVERFPVPVAAGPVTWDGLADSGFPHPLGLYTFEVASMSGEELLDQSQVEIYSTVTEVRSQGGQTVLILEGGSEIGTDQVTALRAPTA
ncbi:flagellar hook capping FlgD N-terminal domain-containing protein [Yoonia sediminilitoris]|uniref:Basal-body rod modification protein FlgD n=1 Tax=Yoonia sediminilitoris TaxID=1286148 RepID=A0A2T6KAI6_9RHOB|nr:flagellar hook capping FlgD N-terminal domain-containing protein [Yoonia sediminilitoris]PUB11792.1 flagellar basal-body rod modification protein FlgD [Yoonia sediminilitoris]RCW91869.1 flagellar basal-body rod modification protein FlgD [Yoonia sediminilitoris]